MACHTNYGPIGHSNLEHFACNLGRTTTLANENCNNHTIRKYMTQARERAVVSIFLARVVLSTTKSIEQSHLVNHRYMYVFSFVRWYWLTFFVRIAWQQTSADEGGLLDLQWNQKSEDSKSACEELTGLGANTPCCFFFCLIFFSALVYKRSSDHHRQQCQCQLSKAQPWEGLFSLNRVDSVVGFVPVRLLISRPADHAKLTYSISLFSLTFPLIIPLLFRLSLSNCVCVFF